MGARWEVGPVCCLRQEEVEGSIHVGREQEGTRSNRPKLAALEVAVRQAGEREDVLYLCDNQSVLTQVNGLIWRGSKATLAITPNADIVRDLLCMLQFCKIAHRGREVHFLGK